ncbi:unnamed protein product [Effrenium voratum]|uniref:Uncharacterized protein n=1 Tax=Effrenium voratum TaxID=2562239 RepID=A0AA36NMW5_9DINO|nr:unnamed protein product [Effrenium voratum]CAJ1439064.1 unnamed protein product [Effrenium voratum]
MDLSRHYDHPDDPGYSEDYEEQRMYGDFYRESAEAVTRGVTLPLPSDSLAAGPFFGDFYRDEDPYKGVTLPCEESKFFGGPCLEKVLFKEGPAPSGWKAEPKTDCPPPKPSDPMWSFEATTIYVTRPMSVLIQEMNVLLEKLNQMATTIKVSRAPKFAIKSDVFVRNAKVTLKVRVYTMEANKYAIEFQRRQGDCLAFNHVYQQAWRLLHDESHVEDLPGPPPCQSPTSSDEADGQVKEMFSPLLDMMDLPVLQAESAAALAQVAEDRPAAKTLCCPGAFKKFHGLLLSDDAEITYPIARLLCSMAQIPEAAQFFCAGDLLSDMITKVQTWKCCEQVKALLAQAVQSVMGRAQLGEGQYERVSRLLQLAVKDLPACRTRQLLSEAHSKLRRAV